jgi:hypothetical protein
MPDQSPVLPWLELWGEDSIGTRPDVTHVPSNPPRGNIFAVKTAAKENKQKQNT